MVDRNVAEEYMLYNSVFIKLKNNQNKTAYCLGVHSCIMKVFLKSKEMLAKHKIQDALRVGRGRG